MTPGRPLRRFRPPKLAVPLEANLIDVMIIGQPVSGFSIPRGRWRRAVKDYVAVGLAVVAGAALFEAALVPGVIIGGVAVLAPKVLPGLLRRSKLLREAPVRRPVEPAAPREGRALAKIFVPAKLGIGRAVAKTITFRIIVTTLDFSTNYLVLGELGAAAGLSAFALVFGPLFYLAHETAWNYFGPEGTVVDVPLRAPFSTDDNPRRFTINRALAKTVTFRGIASAVDFTATYIVVGDPLTALGLTAFGFVFGPFVYYGHEWLWDRYAPQKEEDFEPSTPTKLLPAPVV